MKVKTFYRVGFPNNNSGMWYDMDGVFHGTINKPEFNHLSCNKVQMPFCKDTVGYLSATDSLEDLGNWFTDEDIKSLEHLGLKVLVYESSDYKYHETNKHWLINSKNCKIIS